MDQAYKQRFKIDDTVDLQEIGYDKGSYAVIVVNSTLAVRDAWDATYNEKPHDGEDDDALYRRVLQMRAELTPYMVLSVTLKRGEEELAQPIKTTDDALKIFNLDEHIIPLAIGEIPQRSRARRINAAYTFQRERKRRTLRARLQAKAGTDGGNGPQPDASN